jgi:hypothetical protein
VLPDIQVPQGQALEVAYRNALRSVIDSIRERATESLRLLLEEAQAALKDLENNKKCLAAKSTRLAEDCDGENRSVPNSWAGLFIK